MMRSLRQNTKWIMLIVALAFVGLMVFEWGMDMSGRSSPVASGQLGSVNGTPISYQVWTQTYRNIADRVQEQKGGPLNDVERQFVDEQTWNQLVNQILIQQELNQRNITVTDEEVRVAFRTSPPDWLRENELFQTDGQFDYEKYRVFFSSPAADPGLLQSIEAYYRDVLPRAKLMDQVSSGTYVSDAEVWSIYRENVEGTRVRFFSIDPERVISDTEVDLSDDELRRYYRAHREDFVQPATADLRLVAVARQPSVTDSAAALARANDLRDQALNGADFAELAREHSSDRGSGNAGGDLGWFGRGDMVGPFESAAYELSPGELSEPVLSQFGYHVIKLIERDDDRLHAGHILIPIELTGTSENELLGRVDRLERVGLRQGLEAAADSVGVPITQITLTDGTDFVPGIGSFRSVGFWAFHDSTLVADLSPIYETNDGYYAFELVERTPESVISFEDAEAAIRRRAMQEKKNDLALNLAEEIAREIAGGASLSAVATQRGFEIQETDLFTRRDFVPGLGQGNAGVGAAFGLAAGEIAGPIESNDLLYFIEAVERTEASREAFERDKENIRAQLALQRRQAALEQWLEALRENADIVDNRREFFQPS